MDEFVIITPYVHRLPQHTCDVFTLALPTPAEQHFFFCDVDLAFCHQVSIMRAQGASFSS